MATNLFPGGIEVDPYCLWCGLPLEEIRCRTQMYCTPLHAKRARKNRKSHLDLPIRTCPHPEKLVLNQRGAAIRWALFFDQWFYWCRCGVYHMTNKSNHDSMQALETIEKDLAERGIVLAKATYVRH